MPVISTNMAANTALRYLNQNSDAQSSSLAKLASGSRIQVASDDASGLAVGTALSADIAVLEQASINAQHGEAVLQTADGGLSRIGDILQRLKSLTAQSQSGAISNTERGYVDAEFQQLIKEIDAISSQTTFNGEKMLDGTGAYAAGVDFLVGVEATNTITVTLADVDTTALGINAASVTTTTNAAAAMTLIDTAIGTVSGERANVGATLSRFGYRGDVINSSLENLKAAKSTIMDADIAAEQINFTNAQTLTDAAISALARANTMPQKLLQLLS
ncbi:MAG: flagellin [Alphaproteobacteria bacterium]|nr:MAG: flagellin [Alphaproteobacteria bacterium]